MTTTRELYSNDDWEVDISWNENGEATVNIKEFGTMTAEAGIELGTLLIEKLSGGEFTAVGPVMSAALKDSA